MVTSILVTRLLPFQLQSCSKVVTRVLQDCVIQGGNHLETTLFFLYGPLSQQSNLHF